MVINLANESDTFKSLFINLTNDLSLVIDSAVCIVFAICLIMLLRYTLPSAICSVSLTNLNFVMAVTNSFALWNTSSWNAPWNNFLALICNISLIAFTLPNIWASESEDCTTSSTSFVNALSFSLKDRTDTPSSITRLIDFAALVNMDIFTVLLIDLVNPLPTMRESDDCTVFTTVLTLPRWGIASSTF